MATAFAIDWETGQKTGFFIDQRDNRALLARYAAGRRVLNTFCYSGGFSVYALAAGAEVVHSVDSSKKAIALTERNAELSGVPDRHAAYADDVLGFLKTHSQQYDVLVLDPPAFAKHQGARHAALMGYKRLNAAGLAHLAPGGCCSRSRVRRWSAPNCLRGRCWRRPSRRAARPASCTASPSPPTTP